MTPADALAMVNRAIKRVLQPETMEGVQGGPDEMTVALAFENCIAKAVGPPRFAAPVASGAAGAKARQDSPSAVVNIASSAAITAAASAAPPARSTTPTEPAPSTAQRPAEAKLVNMLTGTKKATPSTPAAAPQSMDVANVNGIAKLLDQPHLNGEPGDTDADTDVDADASGPPPAKPDVEPLTPPAPSITPQPGTKRGAPGAGASAAAKRTRVR